MKNQKQEQKRLQNENATDWIGTKKYGMNRPEIKFNNLNLSSANQQITDNAFYDSLMIQLVSQDNEVSTYDFMFHFFEDQYVKKNGNDDVDYTQTRSLYLIVDDSEGQRQYYMGSEIQIEDDDSVFEQIEIHPTVQEQATFELAKLKITNPEQFIRKYSRCRVGNLQEIKDKLGFVMDEVDDQDLYKSTWISPDHKVIAIGCIPNVHKDDSKIQFVQAGA